MNEIYCAGGVETRGELATRLGTTLSKNSWPGTTLTLFAELIRCETHSVNY